MTKYISRGILIPRVCSKPTILPLLKAQYVFPRNKGKEKRLSYKFFKRHYSNLSYIAITDLAPASPDSVPTVGSGTAQGFLATKAKLSFATPVIKSLLLEPKGSAWVTGRKGNKRRELGFLLPLPITWCSRPPGPPRLWDGQSRKHSHAVWMPLARSCPGFVHAQRKSWYNKLLRISLPSVEDAMMFSILSLETTTFSVLNDKRFCIYFTTYYTSQLK